MTTMILNMYDDEIPYSSFDNRDDVGVVAIIMIMPVMTIMTFGI